MLNYAWECCLELDQQAWELNYAWECCLELDQQAGEGRVATFQLPRDGTVRLLPINTSSRQNKEHSTTE